jgi:hypothetical protein
VALGQQRAAQRGRLRLTCRVRLTLVNARSGAMRAFYRGVSSLEVDAKELRSGKGRQLAFGMLVRGAAARAVREIAARMLGPRRVAARSLVPDGRHSARAAPGA